MSSFLASIFLGRIAPIDIADVCGMNLFDIKAGSYNQELLALAAGSSDLESKLGQVPEDGGTSFGSISPYFVRRYGFDQSCVVAPFTGDNPCKYVPSEIFLWIVSRIFRDVSGLPTYPADMFQGLAQALK